MRKSMVKLWTLAALLFFSPALTETVMVRAAESGHDSEEVLLTFRYRGVGNVYVTGLYDYELDQMYLPVMELFSYLKIHLDPIEGDFTISGNYLTPDNPFQFRFNQQQVILGDHIYDFEADDFRIGEMDYFVTPGVMEEVFDLDFTINMNQLTLSLDTEHTMPVVEITERERAREVVEARQVTREYYPLEYDRNRRVAGFGFADYNITGNFTDDTPTMNYNIMGGAELLGGDIQGSVTGFLSEDDHRLRADNLRWRYVVRDNPWFSRFAVGQMSTTGLQPRSIRGVSVSNDPLEPRRMYETYTIDGNTEADSEVELYLNNRLIDFQRADEAGYYRFEFPLTYGTSRISIQIYTPSGDHRTIDRQIQIPFTFLPPGELAYNVQGGLTETFLGDDAEEKRIAHGDVAYGINNWLTASVGSEYIEDINDDRPFFYGGLSARILSQFLVNLDLAPDAFYRGTASVMFPSGRNFNLQYTEYQGETVFNTRGAERDVSGTFFIPFQLRNTRMGFRLGGDHSRFGSSSITRYRTDLSLRLGRTNLRFNYRDALFYSDNEYDFGQGQITGSLTYTFMRSPGVPVFARGMFLRSNITYNTADNELDQADFQLSRSIRQSARLNLNAGYDFRSAQHYVRLGFTMDLQPVRSTTNVDVRGDRTTVRQNLRGSLGFDHDPERIVTSNRNQVGRAGASVILFIDHNNSGTYDEGDEIIPHRAIRLDRSAQMQVGSDGIIRIGQLQSYYRYNLEVMRSALPNPLLAPGKDEFSFVADPNQYKRIEIPFYRTGVIDGTVYIVRDGEKQPRGGLRIQIKGVDVDFEETIRNFSDGSYYAMDMPPGNYTAKVDPSQLEFLNVYQEDGALEFEIQALAEGDFVENLDILLKPQTEEDPEEDATDPDKEPDEEKEQPEEPEPETVPEETPDEEQKEQEKETETALEAKPVLDPDAEAESMQYQVQLSAYRTRELAEKALATANQRLEGKISLEYDEFFELYTLRSEPLSSASEALELLDQIRETGAAYSAYQGAILISRAHPGAAPVIHEDRLR